jgi:glyoxylase-like metal-dependent hydrolase (beta-lactamase superfamily II)
MRRLILLLALLIGAGASDANAGGIDRLYVLDCGAARAPDQSRWSPGVNAGQPIDIVDNCYLIHHAQGYLLWDTGVPDALFDRHAPAAGPIPWRRDKTLLSQLAAIGVQPDDIRFVAISHTHGDHVGNVDEFPKATVLIQKAEYDWAFAAEKTPFSAGHPAEKLDGEKDVFGDGSVRLIPTPGHTPGHESLLVELPKTGWLLLSGDAAHFRDNFDNRRVPAMNTDRAQTLASMQHIQALLDRYHAQLWINHDASQAAGIRHAPAFYD